MKPGMTISCVGHAAALVLGFMAISAQPMEAPPVQALPVSFVSEKDFSQLTQGVKNAPQLKIPDIKPLADKVDETKSIDQQAPKVSAKPEITTPAAKPVSEAKPEPKAEPKPEPKPELKTELKPAPKPADKPDKPKPPEYKPDQIANLLKKDAARDPPKQQDTPAQPARDNTPKFDANQVAQLLDKREPQRQVAAAQSLNDSPTLGAAIGAQDARLSQSEIDALRARISNCWSSASWHQRQFQALCRASRFVQDRRLDGAGADFGRGLRLAAWTGACGKRQARPAVVSAIHDAKA